MGNPSNSIENNGTSGLSAIVYGLVGDDRGQRFFSAMAVAAAPTGREEGLQGCYWPYLRGDLGAARSGKELSEEQIFALLRHELPAARITAAKAMQEQKLNRVDRLIEMISDPDRYARYGACAGLAYAGGNSGKAVDALLARMVEDDDILFRYFAVDAPCSGKGKSYGLHGAAAKAVPVLLELASEPAPNDPRGHLTRRICEALFDGRSDLLKSYPPTSPEAEKLPVDSLRQFLLNENGRARSAVPLDALTKEQLTPLWEGIYETTRNNAPSGVMFSKRIRTSGIVVMAQNRIKEGLDLMLELSKTKIEQTEENAWVDWFADTMFAFLPLYGSDALPVIEVVEQWPLLTGREQIPCRKTA